MEPPELTANFEEMQKNVLYCTMGIQLAKSGLWEIIQDKQSDFFIKCKEKKDRQTDRWRNEKKLKKPVSQLQFEDLIQILIQTKNCPPHRYL